MIADTIAAVATPPGAGGGIGIIRISGPGALTVAQSIFTRRTDVAESAFDPSVLLPSRCLESHKVHHGYIFDPATKEIIDEVLLIPMLAPHSYTAEDVVEIQAHSGPLVLQTILDLVLAQTVRLADPGEFTRRAFLNGRIDLTQAEAVMDIIQARSTEALKIAVSQGLGHLKGVIQGARQRLISLLTHIDAAIDFPDETGELLSESGAASVVSDVLDICKDAIQQYEDAGFLREGLKLVICGPPNVGKSSLMNRLLERERAIVTDIPGTTRDLIEEPLNINSMPFLISDTAGMHATDDPVERIGIDRAKAHVEQSDLILWVKDAAAPFCLKEISALVPRGKKIIGVLNKIDRLVPENIDALPTRLDSDAPCDPSTVSSDGLSFPLCPVSAKYGDGIDGLKKVILDVAVGHLNLTSSIVPNTRHKQALRRAMESLEAARSGLATAIMEETLSIDIGNGVDALGEITGDSAGVDILDYIFSSFCIGK